MLSPIWRCVPNGTGVGAVALDPDEAAFVLERGYAVIDGERWRCIPISDVVEGDGRVPVRIEKEAACA